MTRILDADEIADRVERLVHLDSQRARRGLDLTVERIARVTGGGRLDFGGSEFEPAGRESLAPELASPEDD
ncbi:MAG: deoxycytidine triphosphate deaminase, partial [Gemmatimonadota bacterium]